MPGGPATENGKAVVRWNATRHGISSPEPVVPGLEKGEDWQEHRDGILDNLAPVGHLEFTLAERVALLSWRLHRVTRYETETIALWDLRNMRRKRLLPRVEVLEKVARYEAHLSRLLYKTLHELEALQARRQGGAAPPLARLDIEGLPES